MIAQLTLFQRIFGSRSARKNTEETQDDNVVILDTVISAEYRRALLLRADGLSSEFLWNKGEDAAKLTVGFIINRAMEMEEVVIYSHSLGPNFYKDVLRGLKCPARILLDDSSGMNVVKGLPQAIQDRINTRVRVLPQEISENVHFLATDYAFRCGEKNQGDEELSAWANLNDPLKTKKWRDHFDKLWAEASPPPSE